MCYVYPGAMPNHICIFSKLNTDVSFEFKYYPPTCYPCWVKQDGFTFVLVVHVGTVFYFNQYDTNSSCNQFCPR